MVEPGGGRPLHPPSAGLDPERRAAVASKVVAQIGGAVGVRAAVEALGMVIRPNEEVVCAATGFVTGRNSLVLLTSQRLLILRGPSVLVDLEHKAIKRFRARAGVVTHDLELENSQGSVLVVKQVHPKAQLEELVRVLSGGAPSG